MSTPTAGDGLGEASLRLDPAGQALLNLWVHRDLDDVMIARLSGGSVTDVARRRARLVEALALDAQLTGDEVRTALDAWRDDSRPVGVPAQPAPPVEAQAPDLAGETIAPDGAGDVRDAAQNVAPQGRGRTKRAAPRTTRPAAAPPLGQWAQRLPWLAGSVLGALILAFVGIAALAGREPEPRSAAATGSGSSASVAEARTSTRARGGREPLGRLSGGPRVGSGSISRVGNRLVVRTSDLDGDPRDFQVWLFDSVAQAKALGSLDVGTYTLPADAGDYVSVDISRQRVKSADATHNGESVLRGPLPTN